jgi:hypothetical protein
MIMETIFASVRVKRSMKRECKPPKKVLIKGKALTKAADD